MTISAFKSMIAKEDLHQWNGISRTFTRETSTGGTLTANAIGEAVDVLQVFGAGTAATAATIGTAVERIGTTSKVSMVLTPGVWTIDQNITIPSNIGLVVPMGVDQAISTGITLAANGPYIAGPYQNISGLGTLTLGVSSAPWVLPIWWGTGTGTVKKAAGTNARARVLLSPGTTYTEAAQIAMTRQFIQGGGGSRLSYTGTGSFLKWTGTGTADLDEIMGGWRDIEIQLVTNSTGIELYEVRGIRGDNFRINGYSAATTVGLYLDGGDVGTSLNKIGGFLILGCTSGVKTDTTVSTVGWVTRNWIGWGECWNCTKGLDMTLSNSNVIWMYAQACDEAFVLSKSDYNDLHLFDENSATTSFSADDAGAAGESVHNVVSGKIAISKLGASTGRDTEWYLSGYGGPTYAPEQLSFYNGAGIYYGSGTPAGNKSATPGSVFIRSDGLDSTAIYKKASGTGSTGWRAAGPTGKGTTADRPTLGTADYGVMYMDTDLDADGLPIWWTGGKWIKSDGSNA
jgi:hypothetical protein